MADDSGVGSWKNYHIVREILILVVEMWVKLSHVPKSMNDMVNILAKRGVGLILDIIDSCIPDLL